MQSHKHTQTNKCTGTHIHTQAWFECLLFSFLWRPHKLVIAFCFEDNFPSWNGGILAVSFSLPLVHVSNFHFSFFFPFRSPFAPLMMKMSGGHSAVMPAQTGGPRPLRFFYYLFTGLPFYFTLSLWSLHPSLSLSLSLSVGCLAGRTMLDLSVLSALCIWMALCARLGLQPDVCVCVCVCVCVRAHICAGVFVWICACMCISLLANVITLQFMNLKLAWLSPPRSAIHKSLMIHDENLSIIFSFAINGSSKLLCLYIERKEEIDKKLWNHFGWTWKVNYCELTVYRHYYYWYLIKLNLITKYVGEKLIK